MNKLNYLTKNSILNIDIFIINFDLIKKIRF